MADADFLLPHSRHDRLDRVLGTGLWLVAAAVAGIFAWIVGDLLRHGLSHISWSYLTANSLDAGRAGGIGPIITSTLLLLLVTVAVSAPVGVGAAIFLAEIDRRGGWPGRVVRGCLDVLASVPSIVFGLFGNALFSITLGMGFSILAGGLTLSCMVLPIVIRSTEVALLAVPDDYRSAAAALGLPLSATLFRVLLPTAAPGLVVGLVLGVGRALGETAALLFTSGYVDRMPSSLFDSGRSLSVHIYDLAMNVPGGDSRAYAAALILIGLLLVINASASWLGSRWLDSMAVNR